MAVAKSAERTEAIYTVDGRWRERAIILYSRQTDQVEHMFMLAEKCL
jgi:nuclear transport factor 2 (NTF2) superfamily protein